MTNRQLSDLRKALHRYAESYHKLNSPLENRYKSRADDHRKVQHNLDLIFGMVDRFIEKEVETDNGTS